MHGEGILRLAEGSKYKGGFKNGVKDGKCIEEDKDGLRFEGSYLEGRRHGDFIEKDKNGNIVRKGTYDHGLAIEN